MDRTIGSACSMAVADALPVLERRRIEATILKHVYDTLVQSHGKEVATTAIAAAVRGWVWQNFC